MYKLYSQDAGVQEQAARALRNFADNSDNKVKIATAGAIPPLVVLLGPQCSARVQDQAAWALRNLAVNADNKVKVAAAGAIPPLVALLGPQWYRSMRQGL